MDSIIWLLFTDTDQSYTKSVTRTADWAIMLAQSWNTTSSGRAIINTHSARGWWDLTQFNQTPSKLMVQKSAVDDQGLPSFMCEKTPSMSLAHCSSPSGMTALISMVSHFHTTVWGEFGLPGNSQPTGSFYSLILCEHLASSTLLVTLVDAPHRVMSVFISSFSVVLPDGSRPSVVFRYNYRMCFCTNTETANGVVNSIHEEVPLNECQSYCLSAFYPMVWIGPTCEQGGAAPEAREGAPNHPQCRGCIIINMITVFTISMPVVSYSPYWDVMNHAICACRDKTPTHSVGTHIDRVTLYDLQLHQVSLRIRTPSPTHTYQDTALNPWRVPGEQEAIWHKCKSAEFHKEHLKLRVPSKNRCCSTQRGIQGDVACHTAGVSNDCCTSIWKKRYILCTTSRSVTNKALAGDVLLRMNHAFRHQTHQPSTS